MASETAPIMHEHAAWISRVDLAHRFGLDLTAKTRRVPPMDALWPRLDRPQGAFKARRDPISMGRSTD